MAFGTNEIVSIRLMNAGNETEENKDDRITIRYTDGNMLVTYKGYDSGRDHPLRLTHYGLPGYLRTLLTMLRSDGLPYKQAQFDFPGFPSVVYRISSLRGPLRHALLDAARATQDSWYSSTPYPVRDDDDTLSDSSSTTASSESTDDDMPHLISVYQTLAGTRSH
jgi:hypothetical protein